MSYNIITISSSYCLVCMSENFHLKQKSHQQTTIRMIIKFLKRESTDEEIIVIN